MPIKNIIKDDSVLMTQVRELIKEKGSPSKVIVKKHVVRLPGNPGKRIEVQTEKTNVNSLMKSFRMEAAILQPDV